MAESKKDTAAKAEETKKAAPAAKKASTTEAKKTKAKAIALCPPYLSAIAPKIGPLKPHNNI